MVVCDAGGVFYVSVNFVICVSLVCDGVIGLIDYVECYFIIILLFGVFDLEIGGGMLLLGDIMIFDWGMYFYYLKIDIDFDGGINYINLGIS